MQRALTRSMGRKVQRPLSQRLIPMKTACDRMRLIGRVRSCLGSIEAWREADATHYFAIPQCADRSDGHWFADKDDARAWLQADALANFQVGTVH